MLKTRHACSIVTLLLVMLMSSAAWAATITGIVANPTARTGRIYVVAESTIDGSRSFGTTLTSAGPFTISGVIPGTYRIEAFVDTQGTGIQHANDPRGASANLTVAANATTVAAGTVTLAVPTPVAVQAPAQVTVYGGSGANSANYVKWVGPRDTNGYPIAERYTVEWSNIRTAITGQSATVRSGFEDNFLHRGGSSAVYYRVTAHVGTTTAFSEWIEVVPPTGTMGSITGSVSYAGSATGPLYVYAVNASANPPVVRVAAYTNPSSPANYTLVSVPPGRYSVIAFLDQDGNGSFDVGDAGMIDTNDYTPMVTVASGQVTAPSISLEGGSAATLITTGHGRSDTAEWFNLVFTGQSMRKQLVGVTLRGPQLGQDVTLALQEGERYGQFHTRIPMLRQIAGQAYTAVLTFSDGTTETVTEQVTAVLEAFGTPTAPVGNIVFNARPAFSWSPPSPAPANYLYSIWLTNASTGASVWTVWGLPSNTTSLTYGGPALVNGTSYRWILNVTDSNGNMAAREVDFTPTSSAAFSSFSPAGGPAGTVVTITGVNFAANPTVRFGSSAATVTAATGSTITASVPAGATTGKITVVSNGTTLTSQDDFYVSAPVTITGRVLTPAGVAIPSARVEVENEPTRFATTDTNGNFTLQPVFLGETVTLRISATGYVPTYSAAFPLNSQDNPYLSGQALNLTPYPFHLYTQQQLTGWGVTAGRGAIAGQVRNSALTPYAAVQGATVTTTPAYTVTYFNGTTVTGTSTAANGTFLAANVLDQQVVSAQAQKAGWTFWPASVLVRGGSVTETAVLGSTPPVSVANFTPLMGKRGSTVTINGVNFSTVPSENAVRFGTVPATVNTATATRLTVTVPQTAVTSDISVTKAGVTSTLDAPSFTVAHTLAVTVAGNGTVNSDPMGITCVGSTGCTADFARDSTVSLFPTGEGGTTFSGWSGACTGTGICTVTMTADRTASANFGSGSYIRCGGTLYSSLGSVLDAAATSTRIEMQAMSFPATNLIIEETATLVGGYDGTFANQTGFTTLLGPLYVQSGELRVDRIIIR